MIVVFLRVTRTRNLTTACTLLALAHCIPLTSNHGIVTVCGSLPGQIAILKLHNCMNAHKLADQLSHM